MQIEPTDRAEPMQGLADDDLRELAYSAHEEAMSFGLSHETFLRYFKTIRNRASAVEASRQRPAAQAASAKALQAFNRDDLRDVADSLQSGYDKTVNVGNTTGEGDEHIESTTAYAARFIHAFLATPPRAASAEPTRYISDEESKGEYAAQCLPPLNATPTGERPAAPAPDEDLMDAFEVNGLTGSVNGQLQDYSRLAAAPAQASSALFDDLRALLEEAYGFAAMSPRGRENINAALDLIDTIRAEAAPAQAAATDDAHEQNLWIRELLELARQWHATRDGTPSKAEAYSALWKHAHNIGPHWRARALLAQASPAQPSGVDAQWGVIASDLLDAVMRATDSNSLARRTDALRTHLSTALTGEAKETK
jgi:hypothetical protein